MNTQDPKESFNIREAKGEDFYKIMIVNESLKDFKEKKKFPWFLLITIDLVDVIEPFSLPTDKEAEILNLVEDNFTSLINRIVPYQYIGRITDNGKRELYYYVETPQDIHEKLNELIEQNTYTREFQYDISQDTGWENVSYFFNY